MAILKDETCYLNDLQSGNMYLISLWAAGIDSLPWRAFLRSDVPYLALRL